MKKLSALLLAFALIAPVAGCGGADSTPQAPESTTSSPMAGEDTGNARAAAAKAKDKVGTADEPME
jgi:ABC-type glycerol-3-phosphate transport system substrate-binding protein